MNPHARTRLAVAAALVGALGLAGCGHDDQASSASKACRSYSLGGGAGDHSLILDLNDVVSAGSWDAVPLLAEVRAVRSGAAGAGLTRGLSTADYRLFRDVVVSTAAVEGEVSPAASSRTLESTTIGALTDAVNAVHKRCD